MGFPNCKGRGCSPIEVAPMGVHEPGEDFTTHPKLWWCGCGRVFWFDDINNEYKIVVETDPDDGYKETLVDSPKWEDNS